MGLVRRFVLGLAYSSAAALGLTAVQTLWGNVWADRAAGGLIMAMNVCGPDREPSNVGEG